jgi:glycosyltransferase EpsE
MSFKISVVIAVYNEEILVKKAVQSILDQTFFDFELIVVNDGSSDDTEKVLKAFSDKRIKVITQKNAGQAAALANACNLAKGKYIANLDADDIAYPERLEKQFALFESDSDLAWVGCGEERIDSQRNEHINRLFPADDSEIRKQCAKCIPYCHSGVMFKKSLIDEGINYDPEQPYMIDFHLFLRVAEKYKVANVPEVLMKRYVRDESFYQDKYSTGKQNKRLAWHCMRAVKLFKLPFWYNIYPLARLIYPYLPIPVKRIVRKKQGLSEKVT